MPSLSLSLNVPGFPKSNSTVGSFFRSCLRDLKNTFVAHRIDIHEKEAIEICDTAGDFYLIPFSIDDFGLNEIKQICEDFEENHPLGRFVDVDLNDQQGNTVSSGKSKLCFFCREKPAIECRRENAHSFDELRTFMFSEMAVFLGCQRKKQIIKKLASLAQQAILAEIALTPKPGLVDRHSSGSHSDMNYQMFVDSTEAISFGFDELVREGFAFQNDDLTKALPRLRDIGLQMESAMFEATGNVNTQKGVIFLMGLSLFACGKLFSQSDRFQVGEFRNIIRGICKDMVRNEMGNPSGKSHGEKVFLKYGFSGARGEAESGFATVFDFGLPEIIQEKQLNDESMTKCLLAIAANNNDTNILFRSNTEVLNRFKNLCRIALDDFNPANYDALADVCKQENISPGGSADLLAVTTFVWSVIQADKQKHFTF
ncbi:2-(5''-triphosphoribosyl)-3'-dephosphocoenzyme-A synthase [Aquipluma nitroreducens]|uniref:2-(5''-triphosphoribosyl)-3'-dephosphocoenzyme-A synthase n=1 Tax=Aquipluma nitroreducens TaxID=2010828 RepID=A0A5K7SC64_9BACT|nr:2-(5''-triphosphoribosyl)-3'-dephosphocoenzyme-A synthase [Aquipluma nitroreducens]